MKEYDDCLALKAVGHKSYTNLQSLLVLTHWYKDLLIDFIIGLLLSANWKSNSYDSIFVIVYRLTKMMHYKPVKITINAPKLVKVIIDMVVQLLDLSDSIINDYKAIFTSKFCFLFCYFLGFKRGLFTAFYSKTNGQTEQLNSPIEAYFCNFVNWK